MTTFIPSTPRTYKGNRHMTKIVGGETMINDTADMLTEPLPAFERRCAGIYPDWPAFIAWIEAHRHTALGIVAVVTVVTALLWLPVKAQADPCEVCQEANGWSECPCLPLAPEPIGGTIPPISGIACLPDTHSISGCEDKVFMPVVLVVDTEQWPSVGDGE